MMELAEHPFIQEIPEDTSMVKKKTQFFKLIIIPSSFCVDYCVWMLFFFCTTAAQPVESFIYETRYEKFRNAFRDRHIERKDEGKTVIFFTIWTVVVILSLSTCLSVK